MFQSFESTSSPELGSARLEKLRVEMARLNLDGFMIPRADAHQGEYVAPRDARLAWLTGFTGSAGFCIALTDKAGVFVDGRYRLQVRNQVDLEVYTPVDWPEVTAQAWINENMPKGAKLGFDPMLHSIGEMEKLRAECSANLVSVENLVDLIWEDQPDTPKDPMVPHPVEYAGRAHGDKISKLSQELAKNGQTAAMITQTDGVAWLLNTRGSDLGQTPVALAMAVLTDQGRVDLFMEPEKVTQELRDHLGNAVSCHAPSFLGEYLAGLKGDILLDKTSCPEWVLNQIGGNPVFGKDPAVLPRACKNDVELEGARAAHLRDGAAVAEFLAWLDGADTTQLTEIDLVQKLEGFRVQTGALQNISFDTICGTGPNGAIMHYRVTHESNAPLAQDNLTVIDSGGQYLDGTTDITRTVAIGTPSGEAIAAFTAVLRGMIAISRTQFPRGLAGRDLDPLARQFLWVNGLDFNHGTGHGVGSYLSVHEGPQRLSRVSHEELREGMILSNEPGYYRNGEFGIRIENLITVRKAQKGVDERDMLEFETLCYVPIDRRLIDPSTFSSAEKDWLNDYHAKTRTKLEPLVSKECAEWLQRACAPI